MDTLNKTELVQLAQVLSESANRGMSREELIAIIEDAWRAVHAANDPAFLFRRDGRLVRRICVGGRAHVVSIDTTELYGLLVRVADWVKATPSGLVPARPPRAVAADMRRFPDVSLPTP